MKRRLIPRKVRPTIIKLKKSLQRIVWGSYTPAELTRELFRQHKRTYDKWFKRTGFHSVEDEQSKRQEKRFCTWHVRSLLESRTFQRQVIKKLCTLVGKKQLSKETVYKLLNDFPDRFRQSVLRKTFGGSLEFSKFLYRSPEWPWRVNMKSFYRGDRVELMKEFDPITQRTVYLVLEKSKRFKVEIS